MNVSHSQVGTTNERTFLATLSGFLVTYSRLELFFFSIEFRFEVRASLFLPKTPVVTTAVIIDGTYYFPAAIAAFIGNNAFDVGKICSFVS